YRTLCSLVSRLLLLLLCSPPPRPTLFPYTTLFRSLALPLASEVSALQQDQRRRGELGEHAEHAPRLASAGRKDEHALGRLHELLDRKSTRLNSSHDQISYAVFCLKKKTKIHPKNHQ